jgi:hypothetical protein
MPKFISEWIQRQSNPTGLYGNEHGDLPVDDPPPADHPSEQYQAWRATAIYTLSPFSAPNAR